VNDTFDSSGFLVGASTTSTTCNSFTAGGPDLAFQFTLSSPAYLFAFETGNATVSPVVKLFSNSCTGSQLLCARAGGTNGACGFQSNAMAPGTYVVVADSETGNGGTYSLVVSRSSTLGDGCSDARVLTLAGTRTLVAGDTTIFDHTLDATCDSTTAFNQPDAIFEFVAPRSGMLAITMTAESGNGSQVISVHTGSTCATSTQLTNACTTLLDQGTLTVPVTQGTKYWIRAASYGNYDYGAFSLQLSLP
jgi:hypothetical protein